MEEEGKKGEKSKDRRYGISVEVMVLMRLSVMRDVVSSVKMGRKAASKGFNDKAVYSSEYSKCGESRLVLED